jgi:nucleoside-diphosphate-sugar epimerase
LDCKLHWRFNLVIWLEASLNTPHAHKRVVVTGGSGHAGWPVAQHLREHGYDVLIADRVAPPTSNIPYRLVDLEDLGQVYGCLAGADAIVHLAAIPRPIFHTPDVVFRTNTMTAFNLFEAAVQLGIRRVVYGSSVSVLGFPFFVRPLAPFYAPIDEAHPKLPQDSYGLSKYLGEEIASAAVRRSDLSVVSLRMPWIHTPATFREQLAPLQTDPAAGATNLWSYIDTRDVAAACQRALEADITGHEAMFIAAADTFMPTPSADLVRAFYPNTDIRPELTGTAALLSSAKAGRILGFTPQYRWQSYF